MNDTSSAAAAILVEGYRRMSPAQKLRRVWDLNETIHALASIRIREMHPGICDRELRLRLASLWIDRATMIRAFHWDPVQMGY